MAYQNHTSYTRTSAVLCQVLLALALACGGGGGGSGGGSNPPPPTTQTITGTMQDRYFVGTQSTTQNVDLGSHQFSALVFAGGTTYTEFFGSGKADGTFSVPSVPTGPYYLKWTPPGTYPRYYYLTSSTVDLGVDRGYRQGLFQSGSATTMTYTWPFGVALPVEAMAFFPSLSYGSCPEIPTSTNLVFDWGYYANDLPNASDQGWVLGYSSSSTTLGTQYSVSGLATLQPKAWTNGGSNAVTGTFQAKSPNATLSLQMSLDSFRSQVASMGPGASLYSWTAEVDSVTTPLSQGLLARGIDMGSLNVSTSASGTQNFNLPYVSDGPAAQGAFFNFYMYVRVPYTTPTRSVSLGIYSDHYFTVPPGRVISPLIGAVRNPRVNGRDFLGSLSGVGTYPTITWDPPAEGSASYYALSLIRINASGSPITTTLGFGRTQSTSIPVPEGLMEYGKHYVFVLTAYTAADFSMQASSRARKLPYGYTTIMSGLVSP